MARAKRDLSALLGGAHEQAAAALRLDRALAASPSAGGAAAEAAWCQLLNRHLPGRYRAEKAFIADRRGGVSREIDIAVYDRLETPILFRNPGHLFLPVESVAAVFEVKQRLNGQLLAYAASKVATVRGLAGAPPLLAGVLALDAKWRATGAGVLEPVLAALPAAGAIDLGCIAEIGIFTRAVSIKGAPPRTSFIHSEAAIALFLLTLAEKLAARGPAPPLDLRPYAAALAPRERLARARGRS